MQALTAFHGRIRGPLQLLDPASNPRSTRRAFGDRFPGSRQEESGQLQRSNPIRARELQSAGSGLSPQFSILIAMRYKLRRGPVPRHLSSSRGLPPKPESFGRCVSRPRDRPTSKDVLARLPTGQRKADLPAEPAREKLISNLSERNHLQAIGLWAIPSPAKGRVLLATRGASRRIIRFEYEPDWRAVVFHIGLWNCPTITWVHDLMGVP